MSEIQTEDEEIKEIISKILDSESETKKKLLQEENLEKIINEIQKTPESELRRMLSDKINLIQNEQFELKKLDRLECEIALLILSLPVDMEKAKKYWKEKEKNARRKKI